MSRRMRLWENPTGDPMLDNLSRGMSQNINRIMAGPGAGLPWLTRKEKKRYKRENLLQTPAPIELIRKSVMDTRKTNSTFILIRKVNQLPEVW